MLFSFIWEPQQSKFLEQPLSFTSSTGSFSWENHLLGKQCFDIKCRFYGEPTFKLVRLVYYFDFSKPKFGLISFFT